MAKTWRWTLEGISGGAIPSRFNTTMHWQTDVGALGSEPSASTVLDKILSHFSTSGHNLSKFTAWMDTATGLTRSTVYERVSPGSGDAPETAQELLSLAGTDTSPTDRLPAGIAIWIAFATAKAGRSFRGGTHVPPMPASSLLGTDGNWQTTGNWTLITALATLMDDTINDIDGFGTDINPVIYSLRRDQLGEDATEQITSAAASTKPRFVRRRMTAP